MENLLRTILDNLLLVSIAYVAGGITYKKVSGIVKGFIKKHLE